MDKVVEVGNLDHASSCCTDGLLLVGGDNYYPTLFINLIQDYGLDEEVCVCVCLCVRVCVVRNFYEVSKHILHEEITFLGFLLYTVL